MNSTVNEVPPQSLKLVAVGGILGAAARWALTTIDLDTSIPWTTFTANIAGAAILGWLFSVERPQGMKSLVGAGFCGGLTTFSTLCVEVALLFGAGSASTSTTGSGITYLFLTVIAGLAAFALGRSAGRLDTQGSSR